MKIVYIAHPISGDIKGNLEKIRQIVRTINLAYKDIVPFAPYWVDCHALDDNNVDERMRGIDNDSEFFRRRTMDEVWLCGDKISTGMKYEIQKALNIDIPIISKSEGTRNFEQYCI